MTIRTVPAFLGALAAASALVAQPLFIETVPVGDPGNPADPNTGFGSVAYEYQIGRYEVTNAQYAAFLNAVAATDSFDLYSPDMSWDSRGGIVQAGSPGSYTYTVKSGYENMPVVFVSFWDAARFTNWLGTGYPEGRVNSSTPLLPGAAYDTNFVAEPAFTAGNRLVGASVFLPSGDEWYKAAYFQPVLSGGPADSYWLYATRSDTQPTSRQPAAFPNSANYFFDDNSPNGINDGFAVTQSAIFPSGNALTDVGVYGPESESYYGTADQNGNVWEWNDSANGVTRRVLQGGGWGNFESSLRSSGRINAGPPSEDSSIGFRVASLAPIPEPGTVGAVAALVAFVGVLIFRRGRSRR